MQLTQFLLPALASTLVAAAPATSKFDDLVGLSSRDNVVHHSLSNLDLLEKREPISIKPAVGIALGIARTLGHTLKKSIMRKLHGRGLERRDIDEMEEQLDLFIRGLEDDITTPTISRSHPDLDLLGF